ncbi:hypothetical protein [Xanthomonas sp. 3058]|uniref:hypothetical protein n=1 Tax=Xanthomonas sp. 3058 TaxID=3035314 RepID=UPI0016176CEC|nr:hypothetical protein [Xanthomonas sp. 3058]MBB5864814.1 hypothetical protein [Xanthomonas sp. 3058]
MPGLKLQVTNAGRAALVNPPNTGTNELLVSYAGIANAPFAVSASLTELPNEIKRIDGDGIGGTVTANDTIHVSIRDDSTAVYECYGFGFYLSDGTLFAVYSQPTLLLGKSAAAMMLLAVDAIFADIDVQQITFGATNFIVPAATTATPGIVELADESEGKAGTDKLRAITSWLLKKVLDTRLGEGAPTAYTKKLLALGTAALFRTELELKGAALKDVGHGKGLDADMLDGKHGEYYLAWENHTGVPETFPPADHSHPENVAKDGDTMTGDLRVPALYAENQVYGKSMEMLSSSVGFQFFWNSFATENGYGCNEYVNNYGNGTGGHIFYSRESKAVGPSRTMSISRTGSVAAPGGFDFGSSKKLKNTEGPLPYGLAEVERIKTAIGRYRPEYNQDGRKRLFMVAEQLAELIPEAVDMEGAHFNGENVPAIKIEQMLPVLVNAIAQLSTKVTDLQRTVSALHH